MNPILIAVLVLVCIGAACAILLIVASKYMAVPVDEKFPVVRECLPGANCGGCGYPGCDGYASALVENPDTPLTLCSPGGPAVAKALSGALGREAGEMVKQTAFVHCLGTKDVTGKKAEFSGEPTCASARLLYSGDWACPYGCLGYGDCAVACPEQAINIMNGLAHVNPARCTGCGVCTRTCPQHIIALHDWDIPVRVSCSSHDRGPAVKQACKAGCIGCGMCMRKCPSEAIHLDNNLAIIDYEKCTGCGTCVGVCPSKCIKPEKLRLEEAS